MQPSIPVLSGSRGGRFAGVRLAKVRTGAKIPKIPMTLISPPKEHLEHHETAVTASCPTKNSASTVPQPKLLILLGPLLP